MAGQGRLRCVGECKVVVDETDGDRAIAAGHPADDEPFLQLRDDRKIKKGSERGLSTQ